MHSTAGSKGYVLIGNLGEVRVMCMVNSEYEGLETYEAHFLVQILISLGVQHLHYMFPVINQIDGIVGIDDYLNLYVRGCADKPNFMTSQISSLGNRIVSAFAGPTMPTTAEVELARRLGCDLVTISNMCILSEAGNRGLTSSASCFNSDFKDDALTTYDITQ